MDYLWLFLIIGFLTLVSKKNNEKIIYIMIMILYIVYFGFSIELGMDYGAYKESFQETESFKNLINLNLKHTFFYRSSFEKGYLSMVAILKNFTSNYIYISFFNTLIILILFSKFIKKYSIKLVMSLLILLRGDIFSHLGGSRQGIAQGFYLYALININKRSFIYYALCIIVGTFFHKTLIIFLPMYFIVKRIYKTRHIIYFLVCTIILFFIDLRVLISKFLILLKLNYFEKYLYYLENEFYFSRRGLNLNGIITLILICIILINRKKIEEKIDKKDFNIILNNYLIGFFCNIGLNSIYILSYRLSQYFQVFDIIIYTYIYILIKDKKIKTIYILLMILYCYFSFYKNMLTNNYIKYAPYKNYFINNRILNNGN